MYYQNTHTIVRTPTHYKTHTHTHTYTLQNKLKQPQHKIHTKLNSHSTLKYPQYKVTLMYMVLSSPRTSNVTHFTSLHFTSKPNHFTKITSVHSTSLHFISLHLFTLNPHLNSLAVTTFLTLFLKMFSLQAKDASKPAGNWFQLLMFRQQRDILHF